MTTICMFQSNPTLLVINCLSVHFLRELNNANIIIYTIGTIVIELNYPHHFFF